MSPFEQSSGCKAVDLTRTCFTATKLVPGRGEVEGAYYFLDPHSRFLQRSKLGGHWWEGKPFQPGDWSTREVPAPTWRDGSKPTGLEYPTIGTCCAAGRMGAAYTFHAAKLRRFYGAALQDERDSVARIGEPPDYSLAFDFGGCGNRVLSVDGSLCYAIFFGVRNVLTPDYDEWQVVIEEPPPAADYLFTLRSEVVDFRDPAFFCGSVVQRWDVRIFGVLS